MKIILTGIAGRLGRRLAKRLATAHHVIGLDTRPVLGLPANVTHHRIDLRRRSAAEVFSWAHADAVIHLGVIHNFHIAHHSVYHSNVVGTEALLNYVRSFAIKKLVVLSSGDVYGPAATNSHFLDEDTPLCASQSFPEIRTLVAVDRAVQSFLWRHPQIQTVLLRPAHIVGSHVHNAPSSYLRLKKLPTVLGFDPILQLIHEDDVIAYIIASVEGQARGIFNIAGIDPIPLHKLIGFLGKKALPLPYPVLRFALQRAWDLHFTTFPPPELDHLCFHNVLDLSNAHQCLAYQPSCDLAAIAALFHA